MAARPVHLQLYMRPANMCAYVPLAAPCSAVPLPPSSYPLWDSIPAAIVDSGKLSKLQLEGEERLKLIPNLSQYIHVIMYTAWFTVRQCSAVKAVCGIS